MVRGDGMKNFSRIIGRNLKTLRKKRGCSLDAASEITGVSKAMLGQMERGESNPTVGTLWKIASGLKVSFSYFLEERENRKDLSLVPGEEISPIIEEDGKMLLYPLFFFDSRKGFEIFRIDMEPGCSHVSEPHNEGVEEYVIVTEGMMEMIIEEKTYRLAKGDSLRYHADKEHVYRNPSEKTASFFEPDILLKLFIHFMPLPQGLKKTLNNSRAFLRQHAGQHVHPVIEPGLPDHVHDGVHGAGLWVRGAVYQGFNSELNDGPGAHGAGLYGGIQHAFVQPPITQAAGRFPQGQHLGVGGTVGKYFPEVVATADNLAFPDHHRPYGHFSQAVSLLRLQQGFPHIIGMIHRYIPFIQSFPGSGKNKCTTIHIRLTT
jgi:Predicted transcriptional regulators